MLVRVKKFIDRHHLIAANDHIIIACSGGSDSVALVYLLFYLREAYGCQLSLAHVNHGLRGIEADGDEAFVRRLSESLDLPLFIEHCDVGTYAAEQGLSIEEAGRIVRYRFFQQLAEKRGNGKIATAHHQDDQAETVLMNLLRGSGSAGLKGILPKNGNVIRPLLSLTKQDVQDYLAKLDVRACYDSTNADIKILRNRIRLCLLPTLQLEYNNHIKDSLCRTALILQEERDFLLGAAQAAYTELVSEGERSLAISHNLVSIHPALRREVFRLAIKKKQGHLRGISFQHVEQLTEMLFSWSVGSELVLPHGLFAYKTYETIELTDIRRSVDVQLAFSLVLAIPGSTVLPNAKGKIIAMVTTAPSKVEVANQAWFDYDALCMPLAVRSRRDGDRFQPSHMSGTQKVKKYLIDHKIPRQARDAVPIVYNSQGIVWLGGLRQSALGAVSSKTTRFLKLSLVYQEDSQW